MVHTPITPDSNIGQFIERLAYAGLIPFVVLALFMWIVTPEAHPFVAIALSAYGATITAFLGGIHWGIGLRHNAPQRKFHMVWGVIPSLVAWVAVIMPAFAGLPLLALLLVAYYLVDRRTWPEAGLRDWMTLRFRLTVVSTFACLLGAAAT
jgi:ABC-type amino acid transport system permease subunit